MARPKPPRKNDRQARSLAQRRARSAVARLFQGPADRTSVARALFGVDREAALELLVARLRETPLGEPAFSHFTEAFSVLGLDAAGPALADLAQAADARTSTRGFAYELLAELTDARAYLRPRIASGDPGMLDRLLLASAAGSILRGFLARAPRARLHALLATAPTAYGMDKVEAARAAFAMRASEVYAAVADRGLPAASRAAVLDALVAEGTFGALSVIDQLSASDPDPVARAEYATARAALLTQAAARPLPEGRALVSRPDLGGVYLLSVQLRHPADGRQVAWLYDLGCGGPVHSATAASGPDLHGDEATDEMVPVDLPTAAALLVESVSADERIAVRRVPEIAGLLALPARDAKLPAAEGPPADPAALAAVLDAPIFEGVGIDPLDLDHELLASLMDLDRAAWIEAVRPSLDRAALSRLAVTARHLVRFLTFRGDDARAALLAGHLSGLADRGADDPLVMHALGRAWDSLHGDFVP